MVKEKQEVSIANPAPLGLLGFGMTTVLLNLHNANIMGFYLLLWAIFSTFMFIGTLKHNKISQVVFLSLTILFYMLAIGDFTGIHSIKIAAGYVGIFCGLSAIYNSVGQIINNEFGKVIMPL